MKKAVLIPLLILTLASLAKPAPAISPYEVIYPLPTPPGVILEKNVYATMRDGVKIALDVYKPAEGGGPWPVIIGYSGFQKEFFFESALPAFYCPKGYVIVQAQARGSCFSQGKYTFFGKDEVRDGYDIVEWIAKQQWCDGNVGMMGASYFGVSQWNTAIQNPPHLKCIVPCPGTTDDYRGLVYPGGVLRIGLALGIASTLIQGAVWPGPIPGRETPAPILAQLFAHTEDGPFWQEQRSSPWKKIGQIKVPVLNIVPTPNKLHAINHLRSYVDIKAPKKLIVTPWTGDGYQPWMFETTSFNQYILRWFDHWLKGIDTGIMNEPEVAIYDNGTGEWRYENEYPLARTQWKKFYLQEKTAITEPWGSISEVPPTKKENPDTYRNPSPPGQTQFVAYTTPPLEKDLVVKGPVSFTLYASTTEEVLTDWSFFIKVGEIVPSGVPINPVTKKPEIKPGEWTPREEVQLWSWGPFKAKFREVDASRSKLGMPWHSFQNPANLKSNNVYEFQVELQPLFKTFKAGTRMWVQIAGDDRDYSTWDASSLYVRKPSPMKNQVSVYHDSEHPSHLLLPVIPDAPEIAPVKAPLREAVPEAPRFTK